MKTPRMPTAAATLPTTPMTAVTTARLTRRSKTVPAKFTTPRPEEYRFQSLIFSTPTMVMRMPTQPTLEVTMVMMSAERTAWASRTPIRPMRYSPRETEMTVCFTTSAAERL